MGMLRAARFGSYVPARKCSGAGSGIYASMASLRQDGEEVDQTAHEQSIARRPDRTGGCTVLVPPRVRVEA